jgi:hypothetical protein
MVSEAFLDEINRACEAMGCGRSQFIRDAVFAELERLGMAPSRALKAAPSRKGKGGPKKKPAAGALPKVGKGK